MPEIAGQRPAPASLTRGNINDFHRPGKISQETANRIRTKACTLYASLLADEKRERNCVALEAVSSRCRLADFTDISAGRAPCDRWMMPQLPLVLYMRRAQRRAAPTPSMLHRSRNSPLHPSEIFHRPTLAAYSSRRGQAPTRDPVEPDCDRSEAQISRSPGGSRVAPIVLVAPLHRSLFRGRPWAASSPWQWG